MVKSIGNIAKLKRASRLPRRRVTYLRRTDADITRNRENRPIEIGEDPLEQRAIPKGRFPGATLPERIVYKKLSELVDEDNIVFQRGILGARNYLGGYVIDFLVYTQDPPILIEVLGTFWHKPEDEWRDLERALKMSELGYDYNEVHEADIYMSDTYLEQILVDIVGRYTIRGVNESF